MLLTVETVRASRGASGRRLRRTVSGGTKAIPSTICYPAIKFPRLTSLRLRLLLGRGVGLDAVEEVVTALGVLDVLNAEVDTLLHVAVSDDLVHDHTNSTGGNVVNDTGSAVSPNNTSASVSLAPSDEKDSPVVVLVRHTLLLSRVRLDIDDVSNFVGAEEGREGDHSLGLKSSLEHVARARAHSEGVRHDELRSAREERSASASKVTGIESSRRRERATERPETWLRP